MKYCRDLEEALEKLFLSLLLSFPRIADISFLHLLEVPSREPLLLF